MRSTRSTGHLHFFLSVAVVAVLGALLLLPGQARAQNAPTISGDATASVAENTAASTVVKTYTASDGGDGDTLTWTLDGDDKDAFTFTFTANSGNTGYELKFSAVPDYEAPADADTDNDYEVTVKVTDDETSPMSATKEVTVTVTNEDEAGTVTITGTEKGGQTLTAAVTDPDGTVSNETWQWTRSATATGTFANISGATSSTYRLVAADVEKFLKATASYTDPQGSGKSATSDATGEIDANNNEPEFSSATATRTLPENSGPGVNVVGGTITASDSDSGDTLTYSLSGTDSGSFEIDSNGQLKTKTGVIHDFNFEATKKSYSVTIEVRDSKDAAGNSNATTDDTIMVTINLTNVNEPPTIVPGASSFNKNENTATTEIIATYVASDVDADDNPGNLTWTLEGEDAGDFTIMKNSVSNDAELRFSAVPDYETPADDDDNDGNAPDNVYEVTVKVSDGTLSTTRDVTITVDDVNEPPTITTSDTTTSVAENTTAVLTFAATDVDTDSGNTLTWSVESTADGGKFSIDQSTGALTFSNAPDFETPTDVGDTAGNNTYVVTVKVTDNGIDGNRGAGDHLSSTHEITVTVTDVNEAPTITTSDTAASKMEIEYDDSMPNLDVLKYTATDPDTQTGNTLIWSVEGDDVDDLQIDPLTGDLAFKTQPNYEMPTGTPAMPGDDPDNTYEITVKVRDNGIPADRTMGNQLEATQDVIVTITDVNERPDIEQVPNNRFEYSEVDFYFTITPTNSPDKVHTFTATDYDDGDTFTWSRSGDDAGDFDIDASTGDLTFMQNAGLNVGPLPSWEDPQDDDGDNVYRITVIATDDDANEPKAGEYAVTITVTDEEEKGTVSVKRERDGMVITDPNVPTAVDDVLTFTLSDPDGGILLTNIDWTIQAHVPADPPGDWESIDDTDPLSLVKTYTVDEDHTGKEMRATVEYEDRRGPGREATSGDTSSVQDQRDVAPPRFRTGETQTIEEGEPGRDTEQGITATDRDGEALIFGIKQGPHSDLFEIIPSAETTMMNYGGIHYPEYTARLRAIEGLDYEALPPNDKTMTLTLTLSDGKSLSNGREIYDDTNDVDDFEVTITVTDVDEPGEISLSPEEVPEPGVEITASLADGDGTISGVTWQWQRSEDGEAEEPVWTNISGATSDSYTPDETDDVISGGDNDGEGYYLRATVSYTDGEGGGKSATAVAGQVGTANTRPQFPASETGQRSVPENSRSGTSIGDPVAAVDPDGNSLTYSLTGTDAESFAIVSSTGQLRTKEALDFESGKSTYSVTVTVHDRRDAAGASSTYIDDTLDVTIMVENVEEPGTVTLSTPTNRVQATVPVTAKLSDPDIPTGTINWQWARSSNRSSWPDNPDPDIPGATSADYIPLDEDEGYYLSATASYTDGHVTDGNDPNEVDTAEAVSSRVGEPPPTNSAPVFLDAEDGQREVRENAAANTAVGVPVAATDHNDDTLKYFLSGSDAASFTIVENTGQVRVKQDAKLDYEGKRTYRLTVQVTDGADEIDELDDDSIDDTISVTVTVTDVNEPPVITGEAEREFRENGTSSVATYSARDPEGDTFTWTVDDSTFVITDRGQLYFKEPPSFEDGETYQVTVTATDDDETRPLSASLNVTITVTDFGGTWHGDHLPGPGLGARSDRDGAGNTDPVYRHP